jgi:hypothetical protein
MVLLSIWGCWNVREQPRSMEKVSSLGERGSQEFQARHFGFAATLSLYKQRANGRHAK